MLTRARSRLHVFLCMFLLTFSQAQAVDITIVNGQTETTTQSATADGDTITIENGGAIQTTNEDGANDGTFNNVTINNAGDIDTTGNEAEGIRSDGTGAVLLNSGSVTTNGNSAEGMASTGASSQLTNTGSITTNGTDSEGIQVSGPNSLVQNNGSITTTNGSLSEGIASTAANNTIINNGNIVSTGDGIFTTAAADNNTITNNVDIVSSLGDGIQIDSDNSTVTNNGNITTTTNGEGIESNGNSNTILNAGTIHANGTEAQGIQLSNGSNLSVTNTGTIIADGPDSDGIRGFNINNSQLTNNGAITTTNRGEGMETNGSFNVLLNTGTITTNGAGSGAYGMWDYGTNNTLINDGNITTNDTNGNGMATWGSNALLINNGVIQTMGDTASGMADHRDISTLNNVIINNGSISTSGTNAEGIRIRGDNVTVTNTGSILVTGSSSDGIIGVGGSGAIHIINSGSIRATGPNGSGVFLGGNGPSLVDNSGLVSSTQLNAFTGLGSDDTVNLLPGWQVIGDIDLGGGANVINISGGTTSSVLNVAGIGGNTTVNLLDGNGVIIGNSVITVDPTGQSIQKDILPNLTNNIHNIFARRSLHLQPLGPVQVAALELTPGMLVQERAPVTWAQVFGGHRTRDTDELVLAHEHEYVGITGGYEQDYHKGRIGFAGGFAHGNVETDMTSIDTETNSVFGGAYGLIHLGWANLTGSLIGGYEWHDNDRTVVTMSGFETAEGDYDSFFVSPSLTLSAVYQSTEYTEIRPSATVTYVAGFYDDYTESGTTSSNLTVDDRTLHAVTTRVQVEGAYLHNGTDELAFRAGFKSRHTDDDDIDLNLAGANFTVPATGDDSVYGGFVGMNLRIAVRDRWNVSADIEHARLSGDENETNGYVNVEYTW